MDRQEDRRSAALSEIIKLKKENAQLFQLLGEITLKLSETQKKK